MNQAGQIALLLQSAAGRLDTPRYITTPMNGDAVAAADMNGDGTVDIVAMGITATLGFLGVLHGLGNGQFTAPRTYTMPTYPSAQLVTPLERPARPSVFVVHTGSSGSGDFYSILRNETP
jgi:hypothetical protein